MKIETDENTFWLAMFLGLAAIAGATIITCHCIYERSWLEHKRQAIAAGMVEKQNTGTYGTHWTKP